MDEIINSESHLFKGITLLVTHYNRSASMERLLKSFEDEGCIFEDIVISDDCSKPEHLERLFELQKKYTFRLITTPINKGLGNNINKGQDAVLTPYTLYVQEDFVPKKAFLPKLVKALNMMEDRNELDLVRFYAYVVYPRLKPYKDGFAEMFYDPWLLDQMKFYFYSDHPHLRRSDFLSRFGRYPEGINVNETELGMCLSVIKKRGVGLFYTAIHDLFDQINTSEEPSTFHRSEWRQSKKPIVLIIRAIYLKLKLIKNTIRLSRLN